MECKIVQKQSRSKWIERLQCDFRRVLRVRTSIPEQFVLVLIGKVAVKKKSYRRAVGKLNYEKQLFVGVELTEVSQEFERREQLIEVVQ